ncbi:BMP family ABC transporter substrate-binding protein [Sutterella sp.]|uniref:BMP family ABC transporter substrate-binding protein n=1 Tax=Sutterella sp. TaxID=1981025 RepID=UPI0026DFB441|nr:BMP family ABC transporter substrate-binding protein [Sutterella sp.]MDO5532046.1 BMP family ABC transporter substrate-binding protein [Sutterella sp.]
MQKRVLIKLALAGAVTLSLAACGDKEEAPKTAAAPAAAPAAQGPLKVAFVYVSPASEEGWSRQHDLARQAMEKQFGDKIQVTAVENIPAGADSERVLRDLAEQGNKLIFATSFGYMNSILKVAKEFPDVKFEHATGYKTAENVAVYTARFYQARYLAGILAGATTKSNVLGYVAAVPIPEVLQGINAFTLGARSVNPNIEVRVVWTSSWYDPGKEADATKTLVGQQADVLTHHTDSPAVASTCEELGVPVISYNTAMKRIAPNHLLAGVVQNWDAYYAGRIQAVLDGTWKTHNVWGGIPEHMTNLADIAPSAPQSAIEKIRAAYEGMEKGSFSPFTGPITDNEGNLVVKDGVKCDDNTLLNMGWLVKCVVGKVPTQQ